MLYNITWDDFYAFLLPLLVIYYLVVILKYYRHELTGFFLGSKEPTRVDVEAAAGAAAPAVEKVEQPLVQPGLFDGRPGDLAGLAAEEHRGQSPEMFKVMATVVAILKDVVAQGVAERIDKKQLLTEMADVLSRYGQLKETPYQGSINSFLIRTCASNFSLVLEDGDLAALWG